MSNLASRSGGPQDRRGRSDRTLLISIHSKYADLILSGTKRVELRRRFDANSAGSRMLIYATLPTAAVVGHVCIERVERLAVRDIWQRHGRNASISAADFGRYFDGIKNGCALVLSHPIRFMTPVPLDSMRTKLGLAPPQSYIFLRDDHRDLIEHEQD